MVNPWMKALAKAAGRSDARIYQILKKAGKKGPYTEYGALVTLRENGFECKRYKPVADAIGKPLPPVGTKKWSDRLLVSRLAKLVPGNVSIRAKKARALYYLKHDLGKKSVREIDEATAIAVFERRGIDTKGFEWTKPRVPGTALVPGTSGNGKLTPDPAANPHELLAQYNELAQRLAEALTAIDEKDKKIGSLVKTRAIVRQILRQYEVQLLPVVNQRYGGLTPPLGYPIQALDLVRED